MNGKVVLCRCEDVTLADVEHSIARGYADIEEVKRYTGFGTGPCQGKECLALIAQVIAEQTGADPAAIAPFTSRPPLAPAPLAYFAGVPEPAADVRDADSAHGRDPAGGERPRGAKGTR